ncbi:MAG: formate dehydrogenase [Pseudomonadales bacterium]|nr:formate dehydrogenase [Pseudomonadales bacterium]
MLDIFVPADTTACALGADAVAAAVITEANIRKVEINLIRNGSRGLFWLEPLVEITTEQGRIGFGPVTVEHIPQLINHIFEPDITDNTALCLGLIDQIPSLKNQQRVNFARAGIIDPLSLKDYLAHGGYLGLQQALTMTAESMVDQVIASGLRGRGGAAFPTGIKWRTVLETPAEQKYIVCNADEGDSGTFADRLLMEADPFQLIEGMTIAALAVGASQGYIYLRAEYPKAHRVLQQAIDLAYSNSYLGKNIAASEHQFDLQIRLGAGAYICGEETALLESLEGKRGQVRAKPPLPAISGLFGKPTMINNVLTLATVASIFARGADWYKTFGCNRSVGTLAIQLAGNIAQGGLIELAFGANLRDILVDFGGGTATGKPIHAVQVGGPLGAYLAASEWDIKLDYETFNDANAMLGHGGIVVFDDSVDMLQQARFAMEFCALESCGKCTPCRIGSTRGIEVIDKIQQGEQPKQNLILLEELCDTMQYGSLCAMGGLTPMPVRSAIKHLKKR